MWKRLLRVLCHIFLISFALNFVWEQVHSLLYVHYKGGPITQFVLLHATFADAIFITITGFVFLYFKELRKKLWISFILLVLLAIGIETWALETGRWAYKDIMPLIPIIKIGLTPTIQLGLLGYTTLSFTKIDTI